MFRRSVVYRQHAGGLTLPPGGLRPGLGRRRVPRYAVSAFHTTFTPLDSTFTPLFLPVHCYLCVVTCTQNEHPWGPNVVVGGCSPSRSCWRLPACLLSALLCRDCVLFRARYFPGDRTIEAAHQAMEQTQFGLAPEVCTKNDGFYT